MRGGQKYTITKQTQPTTYEVTIGAQTHTLTNAQLDSMEAYYYEYDGTIGYEYGGAIGTAVSDEEKALVIVVGDKHYKILRNDGENKTYLYDIALGQILVPDQNGKVILDGAEYKLVTQTVGEIKKYAAEQLQLKEQFAAAQSDFKTAADELKTRLATPASPITSTSAKAPPTLTSE